MVIKPATPGFITTLTATILLAVVSFSVPYFKSVYFLQASYNGNGASGLINFGTLGYCLVVNGNTTCTKPSIGYEFDPNKLLGTQKEVLGQTIEIPEVVTKWITYALFLHVIGFGLAGISAIFGLLAHVREFSMTCFSSCISGAAAAITLIAFIFDLVLFFLARARIKTLPGAVATIGNAIWLTLAAWILLFISGCMFGIGRCCINSRPRGPRSDKVDQAYPGPPAASAVPAGNSYAEQMRMDAIKAEIDRKARQNASKRENGLPAFDEYETETRPLTTQSDEDHSAPHTPYRDNTASRHNKFGAAGVATGYVSSQTLQTPQRQPSAASLASAASTSPPVQHASPYNTAGVGTASYNRPSPQSSPQRQQNASSYVPSFPAAPTPPGPNTYPPQQVLQSGGYARQGSLNEGNIYERAGLGTAAAATAGAAAIGAGAVVAANAGRSDYLRPDASAHPRGDSYGHHAQGSSYYSAYSHQPHASQYAGDHQQQGSYYPAGQQQQTYDPYAAQAAYPPSATEPYAQQQAGHAQYPSSQQGYGSSQLYDQQQQQAYGSVPITSSPPAGAAAAAYGDVAQQQTYIQSDPYGQQQFTPHRQPTMPSTPGDLNFVGVPSRTSAPTSPVGGYGSAQPTSPTRLYGVREEREPSSIGASAAGSSSRPPLPIPEDAPPQYEPSDGSGAAGGWRNEKATYRPQNPQ